MVMAKVAQVCDYQNRIKNNKRANFMDCLPKFCLGFLNIGINWKMAILLLMPGLGLTVF